MSSREENQIHIKSTADFEKMEAVGRITEETLLLVGEHVKAGVSTAELDRIAYDHILACGARPACLGYCGYPATLCTSVNRQVVHGIPGKYRLKDGDIISCDLVVEKDGFHGDACRTFLVGNVPEDVRELVRVTRECFYKGLEQCVAGKRIGDIASAVQSHAESHGYGVVRDLVGHGIGRHMHEAPDVPNFWDTKRFGHGARLEVGMAICVEPMIAMGGWEVVQLDDGWTIETADGSPAAHYENTILITAEGPVLTTLHGEETI